MAEPFDLVINLIEVGTDDLFWSSSEVRVNVTNLYSNETEKDAKTSSTDGTNAANFTWDPQIGKNRDQDFRPPELDFVKEERDERHIRAQVTPSNNIGQFWLEFNRYIAAPANI